MAAPGACPNEVELCILPMLAWLRGVWFLQELRDIIMAWRSSSFLNLTILGIFGTIRTSGDTCGSSPLISSLDESTIFSSLIGKRLILVFLRDAASISVLSYSFIRRRFFRTDSSITTPQPPLLIMSQSTIWKEWQSWKYKEVPLRQSLKRDLFITKCSDYS